MKFLVLRDEFREWGLVISRNLPRKIFVPTDWDKETKPGASWSGFLLRKQTVNSQVKNTLPLPPPIQEPQIWLKGEFSELFRTLLVIYIVIDITYYSRKIKENRSCFLCLIVWMITHAHAYTHTHTQEERKVVTNWYWEPYNSVLFVYEKQ